MKYEIINPEILTQLTSQIGNPNVLNKTIEIIKTIQIESKSIFKIKRIANSNEYNKIANRYSILNIHNIIELAKGNPLVYLTTQTNKENRIYLTIRNEIDNNGLPFEVNHKNGNPIENNPNNLQLISQECHQDIHKAEYLKALRNGGF